MRIAILGNAMSTMIRFRGPLIRALADLGHDVVAICPSGSPDEIRALEAFGGRHVPLDALSRQGMNPRGELRMLKALTAVLTELRPDRLFAYFLKPVIWGAIAARRAGVARSVGLIEGMGFAFSRPPETFVARMRQRLVRLSILALLRISLARIDHLVVLNRDDQALLRRHRLIPAARLTVIDGIGIDLDAFPPAPLPDVPPCFTLAARLIREKGIEVFAHAARLVRATCPEARFCLLGGLDDAPGALTRAQIETWVGAGLLEWHGHVADVRPFLRETTVFVLPTMYREGLPRSIMEAMSMGRPIITTDMPGARDAITDGQSGLIVPPGDAQALAAACLRFFADPALARRFGLAARAEAERRFDLRLQNQKQIELIL